MISQLARKAAKGLGDWAGMCYLDTFAIEVL